MRTKQQIENLRMVFRQLYGTIDFFLNDEEINYWADTMQKRIDNIKYVWNVKIRTEENKDTPWKDIKEEPTAPHASEKDIELKGSELIHKFPKIYEIQFVDALNEDHVLQLISPHLSR